MRALTFTVCMLMTSLLLAGCGKKEKPIASIEPITGIKDYAAEIEAIALPEEVQLIGLGEATHGNVELQNLKKEVFQVLAEKEGCRVFALEADFGGGYRVNEYIHGGEGTAQEAVAELGFGLYRTDEMEAFVQWLRDYNEAAEPEKQVSFYGFDMQRYDNNKEILLDYLSKVDEVQKSALEESLKGLTDETVYTQTKEINQKAAADMEVFLEKMEQQRETYLALSDKRAYETAYACAECIWQNAVIQSGSVKYNEARDEYMTQKMQTIMELEPGERIVLSGHNGHIQKKSCNASYTCMGERLAKEYGAAYYTIGTDFIEGEVNIINEKGEEQNLYFTSENALKAQLRNLDGNVFYFDFAAASQNPQLSELLQHPLKMISIGNEFSSQYKKSDAFYTITDVPVDIFDSMIILKTVTPTARK